MPIGFRRLPVKSDSTVELPGHPRPRLTWARRARIMRHSHLVGVAALLFCVGFAVTAYYFSTLPTTLRISVGPPNSEDVRVVQAIASQLAREHANIRLQTTILDTGPGAAAAAIDSNKADLAVIRHDTGMPKDGQVVAILRKNVVVFIVPSPSEPERASAPETNDTSKAKAAKAAKGGTTKTTKPVAQKSNSINKFEDLIGKRLGVIGRSPTNIELLKVILRQQNIDTGNLAILTAADMEKPNEAGKISIVQFDPNNVSSAIRESNVDAIMSVGPVSSPIKIGRAHV